MAFPKEINQALIEYDLKKGLLRRLLGDQSGIRALRNLPLTDHNNLFRLYGCFNKNNRPKQNQASYQVYKAILSCFLEHLGLTPISVKQVTVYPKNLEYLDLAFLTARQTLTPEDNFWVGLLHWDTCHKQTLLIAERNKLIELAVQSLIKQASGKPCILVAPEYFYSRPIADQSEKHIRDVNHKKDFLAYIPYKFQEEYETKKKYYPGSIRQIEEGQYEQIISFLKDLSSQYPNLILFPGTIAYRKTIKKADYVLLKKRIEENIYNTLVTTTAQPIMLVNHGNVRFNFDQTRSDKQKMEFLKRFKYYAVNSAMCFFQGQQVFSQDKVFNFDEIMEGYPKKLNEMRPGEVYYPETIFLPGKYEGKLGKINDLSFAIDICADHPRNFLKKSLEENQEQPKLHICESAFLLGKLKSQCQAIGGYFLHASSELNYNSMIKREREFFYKKILPDQEEEISVLHKEYKGKSTLRFFKLPRTVSNKEPVIPYSERRMSF